MNKALLFILILVIIGAGVFYFLYLAPPPEEGAPPVQIAKVETTFNLKVLDDLDSFLPHGNFPLSVDLSSLRKSNPEKANDPFFN